MFSLAFSYSYSYSVLAVLVLDGGIVEYEKNQNSATLKGASRSLLTSDNRLAPQAHLERESTFVDCVRVVCNKRSLLT